MRPALGPEQDLETVRLMRGAVGPDFDLMVDAHTWWRMGDRSYNFDTVEQLAGNWRSTTWHGWKSRCRPTIMNPIKRLKERWTFVPLASGEHEPSESRYLDLILTAGVDYVQMDVCCQGGFAMGRRLFGGDCAHRVEVRVP
jgi:L-alanine-DL-glutamate epimerase-like enolase superfamily enzyme